MEGISIRKIIDKITSGEIRIPSFQRGFVWEEDDVAFFMDSLFKGYPIGAVLLWRTKERLLNERNLGHFTLPEPTKDYPVDYVLDGQQRLTSIFSVFQTELEPRDDTNWKDIYYLIGNSKNSQELQFVPLVKEDVDYKKHFPIKTLFDSVEYRRATEILGDKEKAEIDKLQETFKEIIVPVQLMETDDRSIVAIVFERINRAGVPLESFQLLTAWSWSTDFDLQEKLDELSSELSGCGFDGLAEEQDLLMKCFTGYILGNTFISGAKVDLSTTLKLSSTKEFHHIFPDKYLQRQRKERREIYQLANFCFLNNADNQKIKDKAPSEYVKYLNPESMSDVLQAAICPEDTFKLSYEEFIDKRKKLLVEYAKSLIN